MEDISKSVVYLADKLLIYINSPDGKNEILNPEGKESIQDCFFVGKEVPRRFQEGVIRWMKGENVVDEIEKIDGKIMKKCKEVRLELDKVRVIITGKENQEKTSNTSISLKAIIWFPANILMDALLIVSAIVLFPLIIAGMYLRKGKVEKEIDAIYTACTKILTKEKIRDKLISVFQDLFVHRINNIFEKELPREIAMILCIMKFLKLQKKKSGKKLSAIHRLKHSLDKIKGDLERLT